jgi:hypothetical protein
MLTVALFLVASVVVTLLLIMVGWFVSQKNK